MFRVQITEETEETVQVAVGTVPATTRKNHRDVLIQEVETLDLLAVIQAVNKGWWPAVKRVRKRKEPIYTT